MQRIGLFVATNIAILVLLGIMLNLLEPFLAQQGVRLETTGLLVIAAIFGMGGAFVSLLMSKWTAKRMTGAQVITQPRSQVESWLLETVRQQAKRAGIGMPEVAIYQANDINAFATGASKNNALVAVSTGLLANMSREEAEAVLAHEVSHVANGDMVTLTLIQGVLNTFVIVLSRLVGQLVDRVVFKNDRGHGPGFWITMIFAQVVLGLLASMIVMWFSRWREFRADHGGATLAGRGAMIAALQRLKRNSEDAQLPDQMEAFGIFGMRATGGIKRLLMSHPPLDERIAALQRGGR